MHLFVQSLYLKAFVAIRLSDSMKIYTRHGDTGKTSLLGGERVYKNDLRVNAYGDIDELNSHLGLAATKADDIEDLKTSILEIQKHLFQIGAALASPTPRPSVSEDDVRVLEQLIDRATEKLAPLQSFILPGGSELAAQFHVCRTVARRAERSIVALHQQHPVDEHIIKYVNRLSDLMFTWARFANHMRGVADILWQT